MMEQPRLPREPTALEQQVGHLLVQGNFLATEQLEAALWEVCTSGQSLRQVLVDREFVTSETYALFLSIQMRMPVVDLTWTRVEPEAVALVPEALARQYNVLAFQIEQDRAGIGSLLVAVDAPLDQEVLDALARATKRRIRPRVVLRGSIIEFLERYWNFVNAGGTVRSGNLADLLAGGEERPQAKPEKPWPRRPLFEGTSPAVMVERGGWSPRWVGAREQRAAVDRWVRRAYTEGHKAQGPDIAQQCGSCRWFLAFDSDYGLCANQKSPLDGTVTFEHGGCGSHDALTRRQA